MWKAKRFVRKHVISQVSQEYTLPKETPGINCCSLKRSMGHMQGLQCVAVTEVEGFHVGKAVPPR